jgi:5-formyltetrahydrofolate cyclo-ligase
MEDQLKAAKAAMRVQVHASLELLPPWHRSSISRKVCERLEQQPLWIAAKRVMLFAPLVDEPNIWPLLAEGLAGGKRIALPSFISASQGYVAREIRDPSRDLNVGHFSVLEPAASCPQFPLNRLDLVLVPGVAFDTLGRRLGRGRGFYDRLLADVRGTKCGVAFEEQLVAAVPTGPQDALLDCVVTPSRWLEFGSPSEVR